MFTAAAGIFKKLQTYPVILIYIEVRTPCLQTQTRYSYPFS